MKKILIIEDDEITNFITLLNLEKYGYKNIDIALDGQQGLNYLKTNDCPNLILLDINMPVLDGWDFLEAKANLNLCPNIPIIIITSSARDEDRSQAKSFNNIIGYMEKPINFEKLNTYIVNMKT
ncbi:response regulator [Maribacter sp. Asnod1-A12]|uniref:response regulator n=1 Tax=Maribacter sp. Asnod1-A12 TaxID=3160576 RepID=UPI003868DA50